MARYARVRRTARRYIRRKRPVGRTVRFAARHFKKARTFRRRFQPMVRIRYARRSVGYAKRAIKYI